MADSPARQSALQLKRLVEEQNARLGFGRVGSIPETMGFREWCEELARPKGGKPGLQVDKKPFRLSDRPALVPIYDAIPTTKAEAFRKLLVVQKATQIGLTVWEVLADIYLCKKFSPVTIGLFLPDQNTAGYKSEHRFMPILRSAPDLYFELTHRISPEGVSQKIGEGNVLTRQMANSLMLFLWTSGKVSTESRPMDIVSLDEVQEMTLAEIDKVMARVGDSDVAFRMMLSTANQPDLDINAWYKRGSQEVWHTECQECGELSDLSEPAGIFPNKSTAYNTGQFKGAPHNEFVWTCPACSAWIRDPQIGRYIAQNQGTESDRNVRSFLLPRTISPKITPRDMVTDFAHARTGDQKKSFYNRTLARPYIDADQLPVTLEHCNACVVEGLKLGLTWEKSIPRGTQTVMGIDQMGGFNAVIIKKRLADGRQGVVHVEAIFNDDPFERCGELMDLYRVAHCVVEQLPNFNDARRFANKFLGRVYLTTQYQDLKGDTMQWGDDLTKSDRRTAEDDRSRYTVTVHQYKAMQTSLYRIRDKFCLFPDPALLEQDVIDNGAIRRLHLLRDWVFLHFTRTALVTEQNEETRLLRGVVRKVGLDPHFSYANMLCDIAWARNYGTSMMVLPDNQPNQAETDHGARVQAAMPGIPLAVVKMIDASVAAGTCGACYSFENGMCTERALRVRAADASCDLYVKAGDL